MITPSISGNHKVYVCGYILVFNELMLPGQGDRPIMLHISAQSHMVPNNYLLDVRLKLMLGVHH